MPEISRFLGIVIFMYFDGHLPARVRGLVEEWAELHQQELLEMWETKEFHKIQPLV